MKFVVDCHFHPNLPKNEEKALKKCGQWWEEFGKKGIKGVIVTEHIYKNPERAFLLMKKTKPKDFFVFPGMEYLTQEGIDVIIFSDDEQLYEIEELKPFGLTYSETIGVVKREKLFGSIAHPYSMGFASIVSKLGLEKYRYFLGELGAVEFSNGSFSNLEQLLSKIPFKWFKWPYIKKIKRLNNVRGVPEEDFVGKVKFLTAGSDAHHLGEIGAGVVLETLPKNLFGVLTSNKIPMVVNENPLDVHYNLLLKEMLTSFHEFLIKRKISLFGKFGFSSE